MWWFRGRVSERGGAFPFPRVGSSGGKLAKNGWGGLLGFQTREGHGEDGERDLAADLSENWGEERRIVNMARIQEIGGDWVETRREEGDGKKSCHGRLVTHLFETFGKEGRIVATIQE